MTIENVEGDTISSSMFRRGLIFLTLFALAIRVVCLASFPTVQPDEGLWTMSSKNLVQFGDWFMDGHTHLFLSPLFHALSVGLFWLTGPSIANARLLSALAGTISIVLLAVLTTRLTRRNDLGLATALVFGISQWAFVSSRQALIEPLQLMWLLAAFVPLTSATRKGAAIGGAAFALAILTKSNSVFLLPIAVGAPVLVGDAPRSRESLQRAAMRSAILLSVALAGAAVVYGALYAGAPDRFVKAFTFELNGVHFESLSSPLIRLGRFGLDPVQSSRTILSLIREEPFLIVFSVLGLAMSFGRRSLGNSIFAGWLMVGMAFFLLQMFQPIRYFLLVSPAFAFFAARFAFWLGEGGAQAPRGRLSLSMRVLGVYAAFDLSYSAMNAVANRETRVPIVRAWMATQANPDDRVLASALLATDLPYRTYAYYRLASDSTSLIATIQRLKIRYVILDPEWPDAFRRVVAGRFRLAAAWPSAQIYETADESGK